MKRLDMKLSERIIIIIIIALELIISCVSRIIIKDSITSVGLYMAPLIALYNSFILIAIIKIAYKPIEGMLCAILAQLMNIIMQLAENVTIKNIMNNSGLLFIVTLIMLGYAVFKIYRKEDKKVLDYKKDLYNPKGYIRVILYSLIITTVMSLARSDTLEQVNKNIRFRVYTASILIIPTLMLIAIFTASYLAYELFAIKILIEIISVAILRTTGYLDWVQILYIVVETFVIIYAYMSSLIYKKEKVKEEEKVKET